VKCDKPTYKADRPPSSRRYCKITGRAEPFGPSPQGAKPWWEDEPMESHSLNHHPSRLMEYDEWMRHEEKKYSRLLLELKNAHWYPQDRLPHGNPLNGLSESDVSGFADGYAERNRSMDKSPHDKPPGGEYDIGGLADGPWSSELETMRWTDDEVFHGCSLTMEQVLRSDRKPPGIVDEESLTRINTQLELAILGPISERGRSCIHPPTLQAIQMARSKLSESRGQDLGQGNECWPNMSVAYSSFSEYGCTAAINSAGPERGQSEKYWNSGQYWQSVSPPFHGRAQSILPVHPPAHHWAEWGFVMVESVKFVLQRWRGVCSFSQTMRSIGSDEESHLVNDLRSEKRNQT